MRPWPLYPWTTPWEVIIVAESLSVILLCLSLPAAPILGWFSASHLSISSAFFCNFSTSCCWLELEALSPEGSSCSRSVCICSSSSCATLASIFRLFLWSSGKVPLHSLEALEGSLQPVSYTHLTLPT